MKKNEICEIKITGMTSEGNGVGRADDGMAVFIPLTAVGDVISCKIVKVTKSCAFGIIDKILVPSPDRCESCCGVSSKCGGCTFRHITYEAELRIKQGIVRDAFERLGGFKYIDFEPIHGCTSPERYRNKAQYPVAEGKNGEAVCGFYANRSHRVISCDDCLLQPKIFGDIVQYIMEYVKKHHIKPYNEEQHSGDLRHIFLRRGFHTGEIAVCLVVRRDMAAKLRPLARELTDRYGDIKSVVMNINSRRTNVIMGDEMHLLDGKDTIEDIMCGNRITIHPHAFYQVNTAQAEALYAKAKEYAALTGTEDVLDLYCGSGTIGLSMADMARHITGAEIVPASVETAKINAQTNGITNADFICADAGQAAKSLCDAGRTPDVIVIDPPRKGCDSLTLDSIIKMSPERVVMVSCNPATAARDAKYLFGNGYALRRAAAFDLFPRTGHVETVVLLSKLKSTHHIEVELKTDELDLTSAESKATYDEIKAYVKKHSGLTVSSLNIAQVKQKYGIIERENYNKARSKYSRQPKCTKEKEEAIVGALKYFKMVK